MNYLVDTDRLIDAIIGIPVALRLLDRLGDQGLGVSIVSYGEVFEGAVGSPDAQDRLRRFRTFLDGLTTIPLSDPVMEVFAQTRSDLRRRGQLIPDLDLLIASTALLHDLTLVTRNRRHFERIPGLRLHDRD